MDTKTEISGDIQPLTSAELDDVSGGLLHAGFNIGSTRFDIVASATQYVVIQTSCSCK